MKKLVTGLAVLLIVAVFVWQAVAAHGNPDPTARGLSPAAMVVSTAVLVFREGLEAILVLAAVTAGMARTGRKDYLRAVPVGGGLALLASVATWFAVVAIISQVTAPALAVQAATGLLAIVVLLVIMNWFFHKVYWTGWIGSHSNRRKRIIEAESEGAGSSRTFWGLALLGFTAIYREGFEIVLFLQNLRLRAGETIVLEGTAVGLVLTAVVAVLVFMANRKLPFKKMLVVTGVLLGAVLLIMVGEEAQEMQLAGWLHTTPIHLAIPDWAGLWFSIFPTVQTLTAQALAALLVIGSYLAASRLHAIALAFAKNIKQPRVSRLWYYQPIRMESFRSCVLWPTLPDSLCSSAFDNAVVRRATTPARACATEAAREGWPYAMCVARCRVRPVHWTHHLNALRDAGLIETEKRGRIVYARVLPEGLRRLTAFSRPSRSRQCSIVDTSEY